MRYVLATAALISIIGCAPSFAQMPPTPGMGATSPLGTMPSSPGSQPLGTMSPIPGTQAGGIPLGATEINPGGLSPMPCAGATTPGAGSSMGTGLAGSPATFDGGGLSGSSACVPTSPTTTGTAGQGAGSISPTPGSSGSSTAGTIPLDSTELGIPGESPIVTVPVPTVTPTPTTPSMSSPGLSPPPCLGVPSTTGVFGTPGVATTPTIGSANGC